jgi:hypothetical protein
MLLSLRCDQPAWQSRLFPPLLSCYRFIFSNRMVTVTVLADINTAPTAG